MENPTRVWTPSIAPSGLAVHSGNRFSEWKGNLFAGALVFECVRRIQLDENLKVQSETTISFDQRVRDVREGPKGFLYVLTDDENGKLIRLSPR